MPDDMNLCPACLALRPALPAEAVVGIHCARCGWRDDGGGEGVADGPDASLEPITLWRARAEALRRGLVASDVWRLVDDIAVELVDGDDVSPWGLLAESTIVGLERTGARVTMQIRFELMRALCVDRAPELRVELFDCEEISLTPYDGWVVSDLEVIAASAFDIAEAGTERASVALWGSAGQLRLRYGAMGLRFGHGPPISFRALRATVEASRRRWRSDWGLDE